MTERYKQVRVKRSKKREEVKTLDIGQRLDTLREQSEMSRTQSLLRLAQRTDSVREPTKPFKEQADKMSN
jgi:hypothetical protein